MAFGRADTGLQMRQGLRPWTLVESLTLPGSDSGFYFHCQIIIRLQVIPANDDVQPCQSSSNCRRQVDLSSLEHSTQWPGGQRRLVDLRGSRSGWTLSLFLGRHLRSFYTTERFFSSAFP